MAATERPSFGPVRQPHTQGIDMLERALHQLDVEASKHLAKLPLEVLRRVAQVEHCHLVVHEAMMRHLPEELRSNFPAPRQAFTEALEKYMRENGFHVDEG